MKLYYGVSTFERGRNFTLLLLLLFVIEGGACCIQIEKLVARTFDNYKPSCIELIKEKLLSLSHVRSCIPCRVKLSWNYIRGDVNPLNSVCSRERESRFNFV